MDGSFALIPVFLTVIIPTFVAVLLVLACHTYNRWMGAKPVARRQKDETETHPAATNPADDANPYRSPLTIDADSPGVLEDFTDEGVMPPSWPTAWLISAGIVLCTILLYWTVFIPFLLSGSICAFGLQTSYGRGLAVVGILYGYLLAVILSLLILLFISCVTTGQPRFH